MFFATNKKNVYFKKCSLKGYLGNQHGSSMAITENVEYLF